MEKEKLEEENVNKLDFTKIELDYILQNANFNDIELETNASVKGTTIEKALENHIKQYHEKHES